MTEPKLARFVILAGHVAVADEVGRLPTFTMPEVAEAFAKELAEHTEAPIAILQLNVDRVAELLAFNGRDERSVYDVEAQTESLDDALGWARELARRCATATVSVESD